MGKRDKVPKKSRRFLESTDNFLVQILDRPIRGAVLLDMVHTNMQEIIKAVKIRGSLTCSDHALAEFMFSRKF